MKYQSLIAASLALGAAACSEAPAVPTAAPTAPAVNSYGIPYGVWVDDTAATAEALRLGRIQRLNICIDRMCLDDEGLTPARATPTMANTTADRRPGTHNLR